MIVHVHTFMWQEGFCKTKADARKLIERKKILYAPPGVQTLSVLPLSILEIVSGTRIALTDKVGNILYEQKVP